MKRLITIADVVEFLNRVGIDFEKNSIRKVTLPRSKEPFWQFRGIFRNYIITERGDLVSAI